MHKFVYKAWDKDFKVVKGVIEEDNIETVREKLRDEELNIIEIKRKRDIKESSLFKRPLKYEDIAGFCGQMGIILESGVSIIKGLEIIIEQTKERKMKEIVGRVLQGVRRGKTLAVSMEDTGDFPSLLTDMVMSGEASGNIDTVLFNMESFYEREANIKNRIKSASVYPVMLLIAAVGMLIFFNFFVFSEFKSMFTDDMKLPWFTSFLLNTMDFVNKHFIGIIFGIFGFILLIKYLTNVNKIKYVMDYTTFKIPQLGQVKMDIITSRFARSMGIFLKSAVPLLSVLDSIQLILGNRYISEKMDNVKEYIINGSRVADAMEREKLFDPLAVQMIRVGEETGRLEEMLYKLADIYDKRVETSLTKLMSLIEPIFTLIIGIFVGSIIIAMAMPIFQMTSNYK